MNDSASKWDIFLGYSYLAPNGKISGTRSGAPGSTYGQINWGGILSASRYFNRNVGIQVEGDEHIQSEDWPAGDNNSSMNSNDDFAGGSAGFIYRIPTAHFTPFLHVLGGGEQVGSIYHPETWNPVATGGGGLDISTPMFRHHLAVRLFQADYQHVFTDSSDIDSFRLSTGLVLHLGSIAPPMPVTLAVAVSPMSVFPGDPVNATATPGNLDPKLNVIYGWTGTTGITGTGSSASVATAGLAPGVYTVKSEVKEGKPGKEGFRPWQVADASASFTVKAFEPPTIGCSASPVTINPGDKAVIRAVGVSPQNRPLTYTYSASSGTINGNGAAASLDSTGVPPGTITASCIVTDDMNQTATASAQLTIATPPPTISAAPPAEQVRLEARLALHSVFFPTAQPRPEHPEGGLVASQQQTLTTLAADFKSYLTFKPDAHLTLSGHADVRGSVEYNQALSERRVARTKQFLVEQGVPESSIETRGLGKEQELTAAQVKELVEQNPDLSNAERTKVLGDLTIIVLAQNRRVDVTLSTTGQQSVRLYPFNAADSLTLLDKKSPIARKKAAHKAK